MPGPGLFSRIAALFAPRSIRSPRRGQGAPPAPSGGRQDAFGPATGARSTVEVPIDAVDDLVIAYRPRRNGTPDAGEIAWTWVPYQEDPAQGKDRPVLIIGRRDAQHVWAVKLTSRSHDGERDYLELGTGPWDSKGRESWVDIDQVYSVHVYGIRREASALDRARYARVADALHRRYGWTVDI